VRLERTAHFLPLGTRTSKCWSHYPCSPPVTDDLRSVAGARAKSRETAGSSQRKRDDIKNMMTKPTIAYVERRNSRYYRVVLSCGHRHTVCKSAFDAEKWFIGKAVDCLFCKSQEKNN
jgi:hypothetical protein